MAGIQIRWSESEARKPYASPFGVTFVHGGAALGGIAVSGADLLYYRQFQAAVLRLAGEIFVDVDVESSSATQRAWLHHLSTLLPPATDVALVPRSGFDDKQGRSFEFLLTWPDCDWATFGAATVLDYQEFQAALAHQTGRLYTNVAIETIQDDEARHRAWVREAGRLVQRPAAADALAAVWPWRPEPTRS